MEILNLIDKIGAPFALTLLMYFLLRDIILQLTKNFSDSMSNVIVELRSIKEELKDIKDELIKRKNVSV